MDKAREARVVTLILLIVAAVRALAAALVRYITLGEISISLFAAAYLHPSFGLATRSRIKW
jgi:hypothetical protein